MPGTRRTVLADPEAGNEEGVVNEGLGADAEEWDELYQKDDLFSVIIRRRHDLALGWIDDLELPAGSRVLEIGPGAGLMTAALARRGFRVTGADSASRMIAIARRRAEQAVTTQASYADQGETTAGAGLMLADAHRLPVAAETFSLVVALGVVPWLNSAQVAADEMARVLRPGGYLLLNASNRRRLSLLLDPWHCPALDRPRAGAKRALTAAGTPRPPPRPPTPPHPPGASVPPPPHAALDPPHPSALRFLRC